MTISPCRAVRAVFAAGVLPADFSHDDPADTWINPGDVAELAVWDAANRAKDRSDEALDAMRVSNGMTLDQFLESVTAR